MTNESAMNYLTCECIWCVLTRRDLQCCGVLINVCKKNNKGDVLVNIKFPNDYEGEKSIDLMQEIVTLGTLLYKRVSLKNGESKSYEKDNYYANVECISKTKKETFYYLCFHAHLPEKDAEDPTHVKLD